MPEEYEQRYFEKFIPTVIIEDCLACPFCESGKCDVFIEEEIRKNCNVPFAAPTDCPLRDNIIIVKLKEQRAKIKK